MEPPPQSELPQQQETDLSLVNFPKLTLDIDLYVDSEFPLESTLQYAGAVPFAALNDPFVDACVDRPLNLKSWAELKL